MNDKNFKIDRGLGGSSGLTRILKSFIRVDPPNPLDPRSIPIPVWRDSLFWLTLALTSFAVAPFTLPGYFWGAHDARHHVYFLFEYNRLVQDGVWWPRWSPDFTFGYGYPFFNIYGLFSHFLAELLLHFGKFSYTGAIETVFGLSIVGSAASMYLFVRSWLGRHSALIAALTYVYMPYHLLNLYVRANLAESMAFVWLPLCLWTVRQVILKRNYRWLVGTAISYAGLLLTSNLVWALFTLFLGVYVLVLIYTACDGTFGLSKVLRIGLWPAFGLLAGLALSANFLLPLLLERQFVRSDQWFGGRYDFHPQFIYLFQLFSPRWGFGISTAGPEDAMGFQIGVAPLTFAVLGLWLNWSRLGKLRREVICFALAALVATLVGLQVAAPLWELPVIGGLLGIAQFPWRWFNLMALCLSILAGLVVYGEDDKVTGDKVTGVPDGASLPPSAFSLQPSTLSLPLLVLVALLLLSSYPYLRVEIKPSAEGPINLASMMRFQQSSDEMTGATVWTKEIPNWSPLADDYIRQEQAGQPVQPVGTLVDYSNAQWPWDNKTFGAGSVGHTTLSEEVYFLNQRTSEERIVFNHFYYPGWRAWLLDGQHGQPVQELQIIPEESGTLGRMTVPVPQGEGYLLLRFEETLPRTIGWYLSLATALLLLIGFVCEINIFSKNGGKHTNTTTTDED